MAERTWAVRPLRFLRRHKPRGGRRPCKSRRELQLRLSWQSSSSRSTLVPRCSHHKRQFEKGRRTHAPRPGCPGRGILSASRGGEGEGWTG